VRVLADALSRDRRAGRGIMGRVESGWDGMGWWCLILLLIVNRMTDGRLVETTSWEKLQGGKKIGGAEL
jgi:hypothetical protein